MNQKEAMLFYEHIKGDLVKFFSVALLFAGKEMVEMNAEEIGISTEETFEGERYEVKCHYSIKKI